MRLARDINKLAAYGHARIGPTASAVEPRDQLSAARAIESMIQPQDVVLALSNSGETDESLTMLPVPHLARGLSCQVALDTQGGTVCRRLKTWRDFSVVMKSQSS